MTAAGEPKPGVTPSRRALLGGGVAALAAAAGLGWSAWQDHVFERETGGLWSLRLPTPEGGELVLATLRGKPLVLNFWATWCPPCIKEMPELDRFQREFAARGWQVVGIAVDNAKPVREFLQRVPVSFAIGLAGFDGSALSRRLGNHNGALPFTVLFGADGRIQRRKLGESSFEELARWVDGG